MDESRVESLGSQPLDTELARIEAIRSKQDIPALIAHLQEIGVTVPFSVPSFDPPSPARVPPLLIPTALPEAVLPASKASIEVIASLHALITLQLLGESATYDPGFTSMLLPMQRVPDVFAEPFEVDG